MLGKLLKTAVMILLALTVFAAIVALGTYATQGQAAIEYLGTGIGRSSNLDPTPPGTPSWLDVMRTFAGAPFFSDIGGSGWYKLAGFSLGHMLALGLTVAGLLMSWLVLRLAQRFLS